jgi:leucyl-tRNA synthetase
MGADNPDYQPHKIEEKWQNYWLTNKTFRAEENSEKPKYYVLGMFPYPSGAGLHVGHPEGYTATDIMARYKRMQGFSVLNPMGWDAFGLPAEQHAVKTGQHPRITTKKNIDNFRKQIQSIGLSYDWDREINTTDESYYKWTQWIFTKLYQKGLAYQSWEPVNWCEELGTVLANEEVIDGRSEVGDFPVIKKPMRQWVLKITEYAERLLNDLDDLDWPESIKDMQRNWIGKSTGAEVNFAIDEHSDLDPITVFTTRPDTLFGATFMVLAPEHPLVNIITSSSCSAAVEAYCNKTAQKSDKERMSSDEKTGVNTGAFAINPVNGNRIPIFIADYVLASYGHGAIMAVPAHDERDHAFANAYGIKIVQVLDGNQVAIEEQAHVGDGRLINSAFLDGMQKSEAITTMLSWLEEKKIGKRAVNYKLRDWLFSRQRYWGEPIPIVFDKDGHEHILDASELPITLPDLEHFKPTGSGEPPLARASSWLEYHKDGKSYKRETNTMPQWAGSCWYYLRYIDPNNTEKAWDKDKESYWMPVDLYVGGVEHAVLHLLYARFWHKVLFDLGLVSSKEPFQKLVNQGMILGENGEKMSKSRGNVVNPDDVINQWGADAFRLYEMFMGPLEATKPWKTDGINGNFRYLKRFWRYFINEDGSIAQTKDHCSESFEKLLHRTIKKVTLDTEQMRFNTAISSMMECLNAAYKEKEGIGEKASLIMMQLLSPYAPHIAEELWSIYGQKESITYAPWPSYSEELTAQDVITISVQVNGKLRGTIALTKDVAKNDALAAAKSIDSVQKHLEGKTVRKEIFVPGKIVNFVVS